MSFAVERHYIDTPGVSLEYYAVPWDTELLGRPVGQIDNLAVTDPTRAQTGFAEFLDWRGDERISFCSARVAQASRHELDFLQANSFRYLELNYRPFADLSPRQDRADTRLTVQDVDASDEAALVSAAGSIFSHGRFHDDARLGVEVGNRRYALWMRNAFAMNHQEVVKVCEGGEIKAFFVVEKPEAGEVFWSLVGLMPDALGRGTGFRVWSTMLAWLREAGVQRVSTSISSLNAAVFNLYVKLGFRFPEPDVSLHWHAETA